MNVVLLLLSIPTLVTINISLPLPDAVHLYIAAAARVSTGPSSQDATVASYCLLLPGKTLHISALLLAKHFRKRGNKDGAVRAIKLLQSAELGTVVESKQQRGAYAV